MKPRRRHVSRLIATVTIAALAAAAVATASPATAHGITGATASAGQVHVLYGSSSDGFTSTNDQIFDLSNGFNLSLQAGFFGFALR